MPERPSVATHAHTVDVGIVEIETGLAGFRPDAGAFRLETPSLVKIGITNHLQLDLFGGIGVISQPSSRAWGAGDLAIGVKWRLLDSARGVGDLAVQPTVKLPTGSTGKGTGTGTTDVAVTVVSSHAVGGVTIDTNVGATWRSGDGSAAPTMTTVWAVSTGVPVRGRLGWVAEVFGYPGTRGPSGQQPLVGLLSGPSFAVSRSVVVDAAGIIGVAGNQPRTICAGLTWNVGQLARASARRRVDRLRAR